MTKLIYENVGKWCHYSTAWFLSSQPQPYQFPHMQLKPCLVGNTPPILIIHLHTIKKKFVTNILNI